MANRSKHKPVNSEQAARLLGMQPAFLSFEDASNALLSNPESPSLPTEFATSEIDCDFQNIFRHLSKKDTNTKLKALQEFNQTVQNKDIATLEKTVNYWHRFYRKLSNSTDSKLRLEVHLSQKVLLSKFDLETSRGFYHVPKEELLSSEVSFQKLLGLPAILWTACFEQSPQSGEAARQILTLICPTSEDRLQFLIDNHITILNYCAYTIFRKIPVELFYSTPLSNDAQQVFDEHLLTTTLMGLSSLINDLMCADEKLDECEKCLRNIFDIINGEFIKSKLVFTVAPVGQDLQSESSSSAIQTKDKDKKKTKRKDKNEEEKSSDSENNFKFWTYEKVENYSVRTAFYSFLNSLTRLTTKLLQHPTEARPDANGTILWFKLYKNVFLNKVFYSFSDTVAQIRGHAWLLVAHILLNHDEYKPWSVVSHDKWKREVLFPFIENGCKPREGVMDFGLINIVNRPVYPEFFSKKFSNQSAFKMICDSYSLTNVVENVKLITVFADAYQSPFDVKKEDVYFTMISAFKTSISKVFLLSDAKFLVEVYFNLIYHYILRCFVSDQDFNSLSDKFEQIFQVYTKNLILDSFNNSQDILPNSHFSLNLLILIRNVNNDYKQNIKSYSSNVYQLFKVNIYEIYSDILSYSKDISDKSFKKGGADPCGFKNYLKSLNFLFLLQHDGYFSCEYYYLRASTDYTKNFMNIFKSRSANEQIPKEKKVQFQVETDTSNSQGCSSMSIEDTAFVHVSLFNPSFSDFKSDSRAVLPEEFAFLLFEKFSVTVARLCRKFENEFVNGLNEGSMILLYHLQYYFRIFDVYSKDIFLREMNFDNIKSFIEQYLLNCVISLVKIICQKENFTSLKLEMTILQKLFDWILIAIPTGENDKEFLSDLFSRMDSFAFILFIEHLDKLKSHPFSLKYEQKLAYVRLKIDRSIYLRSLQTEIEKILIGDVSKIKVINMTKLLDTYLGQCNDPVKLESAFTMLCNIPNNDCFDKLPGANWYHARAACLFHLIVGKIDFKLINNLDQFTTNLSNVVKYFLDKSLKSKCSSDFTSEQFNIVYNFVKFTFQFCSVFAPKLGPILEDLFINISQPNFYYEHSPTMGNSDRLEYMEKIINLCLDCLKILPEYSEKSQKIFKELLQTNTASYRNDITPILFATEGDDSELKLLAFYEILTTERSSVLVQSDFLHNIKFETIAERFKISYFYYQSLIINRIFAELYQDKAEDLLNNPSGTIVECLKDLFKIYFYFDQSFVMPMSQNSARIDKQKTNSNNVEFGLFNEQLSNCIETLTQSDPDLKMKLFIFLVDIQEATLNNVLFSFFLNQNFFFMDFSEIFQYSKMESNNDFGIMILSFLENRDYDRFLKSFEEYSFTENSPEFQHRELTVVAHQKLLYLSYVLIWETSSDQQDMACRVKHIVDYINLTKLLEFLRNHPEEKIIASLFAKVASEIVTNCLSHISNYEIFYEIINCLIEIIQRSIFEQETCLDFFLSSRILKALIDCNQEICKQTSKISILDWKHFTYNIANDIILKLVFQMREFNPVDFIQNVFAKRIAHSLEWFDDQTLKLSKDEEPNLGIQNFKKLELEAKLDTLISDKKLEEPTLSKIARKGKINMETGSEYHDTVLSIYFSLLFHPNLQWTLGAYYVLSKTLKNLNCIMPEEIKVSHSDCGDPSEIIEDDFLEPFKVVAQYFRKLNAATHVIFDEYEFAEEVLLEPKTDLYDYALAYLLFWKLYLELVESFNSATAASDKIKNNLMEYFIENKFHETLLQVLFHLMMNVEENLDPEDDDYFESFSVQNIGETLKNFDNITRFCDLSTMFRDKHISLLPRLAQIVYYQCLKTLPGVVRSWSIKQKQSDRELVEGFTMKYFTGTLVSSEYDRFLGEKDFGNVAVRFNKRDKDIFLVYTLNDIRFKIKFSFPCNYPLSPLNIECLDHCGVSDEKTKKWIHQLIVFFSKENCSIKDGIVMLKPNMDKFFENFDECMICLFVLYGATKELPRFTCGQCRKKFHVTCIRRWFHTNNQATCPLCKFKFYRN